MSTDDNKPVEEDPMAAWAEALEEQKGGTEADQGGPLTGESVRPFSSSAADAPMTDIDRVLDIPVQLSVELGRTKVPIKHILQLGQGSVVELDALARERTVVLVDPATGKLGRAWLLLPAYENSPPALADFCL